MQPHPSSLADIAAQLPPQVVATLTELFSDDLAQWSFIINLFFETMEQDLVSLDKAIRAKDDRLVIEAAHRIAGSARMLGHLLIGDAARAIERLAQTVSPDYARGAHMQAALDRLLSLAESFRVQASRCAWSDAPAAG